MADQAVEEPNPDFLRGLTKVDGVQSFRIKYADNTGHFGETYLDPFDQHQSWYVGSATAVHGYAAAIFALGLITGALIVYFSRRRHAA